MLTNSSIQLPDYVHTQVIENEVFVFIDKTSKTFCFNEDILWLLETLNNNSNTILFSTLLEIAQNTFSDESLSNIKTFLIDQIQQLVKLHILLITD